MRIIARLLTNDFFSFLMLWIDRGNVHNPSWLGLVSFPSLFFSLLFSFSLSLCLFSVSSLLCSAASIQFSLPLMRYIRCGLQWVNILGATMAFKDPTHTIINIVVHLFLALLALVVVGAQWEVSVLCCGCGCGYGCAVMCCAVLCCVVLCCALLCCD